MILNKLRCANPFLVLDWCNIGASSLIPERAGFRDKRKIKMGRKLSDQRPTSDSLMPIVRGVAGQFFLTVEIRQRVVQRLYGRKSSTKAV